VAGASRTEVDQSCTLCGGSVEVAYRDGWVYVRCTECEGLWADDDGSGGHLAKFSLTPTGLVDRSAAEVYAAGWGRTFQKVHSMIEGVCPTCAGPVERSLDVCEDHGSEGRCPECGRRSRIVARLCCSVCKEWARTTLGGVAAYHPSVVGFWHEHGLNLQYGSSDLAWIVERLERGDSSVDLLSTDPPRVRVRTELDGDECYVELDRDLNVVDVG
jgi:predicted RNA-binding Zn-ribbon protein involved in translation (DUF1610 family)